MSMPSSGVPWVPDSMQQIAVRYLIERNAAGLLLDPGGGKTAITYAAYKILRKRKMARRVLVVCPLKVLQFVWVQERDKWEDFHDITVTRLHSDFGKMEKLADAPADFYIINFDNIQWLMKDDNLARLDCDIVVWDELSKFKNPSTQRIKTVKKFLHLFARRWGLTGSPVPKSYMNLFGEALVLDMGKTFGPYITHFREQYFDPSGYMGYDWTLKDKADKKIQKAIKPVMLRLELPATAGMPKLKHNPIMIDLPPKARAAYDEMEDKMFTQLEEANGRRVFLESLNGAGTSGKCHQIAQGSVYTNAPLYTILHEEKIAALENLIDELQGSPLLVAYQFQHDLEAIMRHLGKTIPYLGRGIDGKAAIKIEQQWNRGELPVLVAQSQAVGHGANLQQAGNHVCWYGLTWDFEIFDQFIRRVWRRGNKHNVVYSHAIMAANTVDQVIWATMHGRDHTQKGFLAALRDYRIQRHEKIV